MKTNPDDQVDGFLREDEVLEEGHGPLTKREYFAALAMQSLQNVLLRRSGEEKRRKAREALIKNGLLRSGATADEVVAHIAVEQADALIKALNQNEEEKKR